MMEPLLKLGLQVAGVSQLLLTAGSFAIPRCLRFSERTASLIPLMRQMFFTYAIYVLVSHLFFGIITLALADELLKGTPLANALLIFMGAWWVGRLVCQFFFFDRSGIPESRFNKSAEVVLVTLFVALVVVYWGTLIWNLTH